MTVNRIALTGFRNYEWETVEFSPGTNVITGDNAQGKTNLLEAVYLLSCGRGFRTRTDKELVHFGYSSCEVLSDLSGRGRDQTVLIRITPGTTKKIQVNGVRTAPSALSETINVVLFCPEDLMLVKAGAVERRKFLDGAICQLRPRYAALLTEYNRLLEQKSRILKDWREKPSLLEPLDEFSDALCRCAAGLLRYRAAYTVRLEQEASAIHREFSGDRETLQLQYRTVSTVTDPLATEKELYYRLMEHLETHRQAEIESGQCLTGVHRDDLEIFINEDPARTFASQGQTRTAALSLKLGERELLSKEIGEEPVLLLDDVLSELDRGRQEFVLNRLQRGQTLITCCEDRSVAERTGGKVLFVESGKIKEGIKRK